MVQAILVRSSSAASWYCLVQPLCCTAYPVYRLTVLISLIPRQRSYRALIARLCRDVDANAAVGEVNSFLTFSSNNVKQIPYFLLSQCKVDHTYLISFQAALIACVTDFWKASDQVAKLRFETSKFSFYQHCAVLLDKLGAMQLLEPSSVARWVLRPEVAFCFVILFALLTFNCVCLGRGRRYKW
jgi:hypothetical protein